MSARQRGLEEEIREVKKSVAHKISTNKDMEPRLGTLKTKLIEKSENVENNFKIHMEVTVQQGIKEYFDKSQDIKKTLSAAVKEAIASTSDLNVMVQTKVSEAMGQVRINTHDTRKEIRHVAELKQEEEKKNNLIVHNLEEKQDNVDIIKIGDTNDTKDFLVEITRICGVAMTEEDILNCYRIGKRGTEEDKIRPILIKLTYNFWDWVLRETSRRRTEILRILQQVSLSSI